MAKKKPTHYPYIVSGPSIVKAGKEITYEIEKSHK